jgi:hypothetical protein
VSDSIHHNKPLIFSSLISYHSDLHKLYQHTEFLQKLNNCLSHVLDEPLNQHCQIANFDNNILTILADSPAWSAKLRYNTSKILNHMRTDYNLDTLKTIRIIVRPIENLTYVKTRKLNLSPVAAKFIIQVAETITDEKLRASLLNLAKHNKNIV